MAADAHANVFPIRAEMLCSRCGFPLAGRFVRTDEGHAHADIGHCDQLAEADEVATYLEGVSDRLLTDELSLKSTYSHVTKQRVWTLVHKNLDGKIVTDRQLTHETLPDFLLRISGGLLK